MVGIQDFAWSDWRPVTREGVDHNWKDCMIEDALIPTIVIYLRNVYTDLDGR